MFDPASIWRPAVRLAPAVPRGAYGVVPRLFARLDEARETSALPEEPANESEVKAWLLGVQRRRLL